MKSETVIKVLNRYIKGLDSMRQQAWMDGGNQDAKQYEFDLRAIEQARDFILEKGKE